MTLSTTTDTVQAAAHLMPSSLGTAALSCIHY